MQLKSHQFSGHIGAVCFHADKEREPYRLGATFVIHPLIEAGKQLAEHMLDSLRKMDS
jgi:hypothetical protein